MKVGFIGLGNMGGAVLRAVAAAGQHTLLLSNHNLEKAQALQASCGGQIVDNQTIIAQADVIFLGIKPHVVRSFLTEQAHLIQQSSATWISMAAGLDLATLADFLPADRLIRMMPNTPVAIGQGMTTFATLSAANAQLFTELMSASGQVLQLPENLIDAATAIAGCGPAFVYEFIQALTTAGVQNGLAVADAQFLACQTALGSAQLVLDSGQHPAALRDQVTSPGGSTIAGVVTMTQAGFQAATIDAVNAALDKTIELGK